MCIRDSGIVAQQWLSQKANIANPTNVHNKCVWLVSKSGLMECRHERSTLAANGEIGLSELTDCANASLVSNDLPVT